MTKKDAKIKEIKKTEKTDKINKKDFMVMSKDDAQKLFDGLLEMPIKYTKQLTPMIALIQEAPSLEDFEKRNK